MLRSTLLKTLRDHRWGALGWGTALGALLPIIAWAWIHAYPDPQARRLIADQIEHGGLSIVGVFYGEPRRIDTLGGAIAWRGLGLYPVLLGLYVILAATGATRGAEERGDLELALATPQPRARLFVEQVFGLLGVLLVAGLFLWLGLLISGPTWHQGLLDPARSALAVVDLLTAVAFFGAIALLAAQCVRTTRAAALIAGVLLVASHLWNNLAFVVPSIRTARAVSALYLYSRSTPLADGRFDVAAWSLLVALAVAVSALAGVLFSRRDIHGVAVFPLSLPSAGRFRGRRVTSGWLLTGPVTRGLRSLLAAAIVWGSGLGAYAALFAALDRNAVKAFRSQQNVQDILQRLGRASLATDAGFIALVLFGFLPTLLSIYGVTVASSWASEESSGWLELELSCPVSRPRYYLSRLAAALIATSLVVAMLGVFFLVAAVAARLDLPWGRALGAVILLVPMTFAVLAFGFAVSTWRPNAVGALAGVIVGASFFLYVLAPLFNAPHVVRDLSVFQLYGQPLIDGIDWLRAALLCLLGFLLAAYGAFAFERKDLAK